ncbi:hypothetical protein HPCPY1962_1633 [Helicobacter pylori CPY1962]|nr:hypothetical protein HPCPY1962_1633 [Helicobacter pylori CPY1962]
MNACLKVAIGNNLKKRNVFKKKSFNFLAYNGVLSSILET